MSFCELQTYFFITQFFEFFFDKVMYDLLNLLKHEILYCCQFGFRKNHSTSLALIHLINKISSKIHRHEITAGVLLDVSKTFDTLDHETLFTKLEHYGICDVALKWIKSFHAANNLRIKSVPQRKLSSAEPFKVLF